MPPTILLVGLTFVTVSLLVLAIAHPGTIALRQRLAPYGYGGAVEAPSTLSAPFWRRILMPFLQFFVRAAGRVTPAHMRSQAERDLELAGDPIDSSVFLTLRLVSLVGLGIWGLLPLLQAGKFSINQLFLALVCVYLGMRAPLVWLNLKISARRHAIERGLPDAMDLVVVCMEAGMSFDAALHKVVEKTKGPLRQEIEQTLQEMHLGKLRREALKDLGRRTAVPDLVSVVGALVQADQMGLSIAHVLRAQADDLRVRRRQRAEARAMEAPVKMLFPLVLFIFPAMMIVTLGPAVMAIYSNIISRLSG